MFFLVHDPCPEFLAIHIQGCRCYRLSVRRCGHIGLRPAIDIFFGWKNVRLCDPSPYAGRNTTIAAHSKLPPGILVRNRARLLTYPLGVPLFAPRACLHRVRSMKQVPNRHCALFTLICLTQKRYVTNQCASWGVTHCPPSMELYPGDTLVACNYTGEANDIKRLSGGYSGIRRELYALAFEEPWYSIYIYPRRQFAYPSLPQDLVT